MISPTDKPKAAISQATVRAGFPNHKKKPMGQTLQGVLVNSHLKENENIVRFDEICDSLMIFEENPAATKYTSAPREKSFDTQKTLTPVIIGTSIVFAAVAALSAIYKNRTLKNYNIDGIKDTLSDAKKLRTMLPESPKNELPSALGININIREEHEFSAYRALRDPSIKNIKAAAATFLFSGLTVAAKNFVDGVKDIWIKKQEADIERDLQESLIEVETKSFSGKLQAVNGLLQDTVKYFKGSLNKKPGENNGEIFFKKHFKLSFSGNKADQIQEGRRVSEEKDKKKKNALYILGVFGALGACLAGGKYAFSNFKKAEKHTLKFKDEFNNAATELMDKIIQKKDTGKKDILELLSSYLYVKPEALKSKLTEAQWAPEIAQSVTKNVDRVKSSIYTTAPEALAGSVLERVQYYCYMNEPRGHLYTWLVNSENKFAKNLFLTFTAISGTGYIFNQGVDAIKSVAVASENSKTELNLKKRLVDIEIENFESKKRSAIEPLINNFNYKKGQGDKSQEELKCMAENILFEIKNGPPYVYS